MGGRGPFFFFFNYWSHSRLSYKTCIRVMFRYDNIYFSDTNFISSLGPVCDLTLCYSQTRILLELQMLLLFTVSILRCPSLLPVIEMTFPPCYLF